MVVLRQSASSQAVRFIPTREGIITKCVLRDETTNVETTYDVTTYSSSYFRYFEKILTLEEGKYYDMELKTSADALVHKDRIFCTNQSVDTYSINNGQYVQNEQPIIIYD